MVAEVDAATALVVTVNVTLVAPTGTVTLAGTVAAELLLDSVTCAPPAGAGPFNVTVPVELPVEALPPVTVVGVTPGEGRRTGCGVTGALARGGARGVVDVPVAEVDAPTALVVTVNVPLVAPTGTVTLAGTVAAVLSLDSVTCAPPAGAGPSSVAVPVELLPPVTVVGFTPSEERRTGCGFTVRVAVRVTPLYKAEMVTGVDAATALVVTVNVTLVAPTGTVTLAGTVAAVLLLAS